MVISASAWFIMPSFSYNNGDDTTHVDKNFQREDAKGIVVDTQNKKVYYDAKATEKMHFFKAWDYCHDLTFNSHRDWRVLSKEEAVSLLELSRSNLNVKHAFKNVLEERYWTATQDRFDEAWYVDFDLGRYSTQKETYKYRTICVRDMKE